MGLLSEVTGVVVRIIVAEVAPTGILTLGGTLALLFAQEKATIASSTGAPALSFTVTNVESPP